MNNHLTVDTNILIDGFANHSIDHTSFLHLFTRDRIEYGLALDQEGEIQKEYEKNLGNNDFYRKWLNRLFQLQSICIVPGKLSKRHGKKLKSHGCHQKSDHTFIAVAEKSGKVLITEDSDFGKGPNGNQPPHDKALEYIQNVIGIRVLDVTEARKEFGC